MQDTALYEFPLNERMRNFMRLENCFAQINHFAAHNTIWDSQASLLVLIEVLNIMERHDIKNEVTKELERSIGMLSNLLDIPGVDIQKLQDTLKELTAKLHAVQKIDGKVARSVREDDIINSIRQRTSSTSNVNSFEIPSYYYWLNKLGQIRQQQIYAWLKEVSPCADAISLILNLIRNSATFNVQTATAGFFQKTLNSQQSCQMVRIELPIAENYFPETSGSRHRISVRFLTYENAKQRPIQVIADVPFNISCCGI